MYDAFSDDYDRFVNWENRLAFELPFLEQRLNAAGARRVLDAACGTGQHAIALARRGYAAAGTDLSVPMIARARENAVSAGVNVPLAAVGFGGLAQAFGGSRLFPFDAVLCLGNSLPHVLSEAGLRGTLGDFAACLQPGGVLILQNRNFDAVVKRRERWMEPQSHREGEREWLFLRFYDYQADGLISFNIIHLRREGGDKPWEQRVMSTPLRPLLQEETVRLLGEAGFSQVACYGDMSGSPFNPETSGNLVVVAKLAA
jgi:glycine/sarcosine N-methyltransferase